jgi:hypothetical protein
METAERYAPALRRELCSAERLSEAAIRFGSRNVKTPRRRSSASLSRLTRCDQRFGVFLRGFRVVALLFVALRLVGLREVGLLVFAITNPFLLARTSRGPTGSYQASRELQRPTGIDNTHL